MKGLVAATSGAAAGKPTLYFYVTKVRKGDTAGAKCIDIEEEVLFTAEPKNAKPREGSVYDFRAAIAAKHFNVVRIDVSDITSGPVSAAKAPLIVITDSKGEVKQQVAGASITAAKLYTAMAAVMKDEGKDISKPVTKAAGIMSKLYALEVDIQRAKARTGRAAKAQQDQLAAAKSQGQDAYTAALADLKG